MSEILELCYLLIRPFPLGAAPVLNDPYGVERFGYRLQLRSVVMPFFAIQNICRMPASVVRVGLDEGSLPTERQVIGRIGHDQRTLRVAAAIGELRTGRARLRACSLRRVWVSSERDGVTFSKGRGRQLI